jgi:hypothetical protein
MTEFRADYHPLSAEHRHWGSIACLPWDERIFGFPVADLKLNEGEGIEMNEVPAFRRALEEFARFSGAELISLAIPALRTDLLRIFIHSGFLPVDLAEDASASRLHLDWIPKARIGVRLAEPDDSTDLLHIAGDAFNFGRYHTDPRFPRELANRRYVKWLENALDSSESGNYVFVLGSPRKRLGFFHVVLSGGTADLRLAAKDPATLVGLALYSETLLALRDLGAKRFMSRISAANTAVLNLYSSMGFQLSNPEYLLHWHSPSASHLRS